MPVLRCPFIFWVVLVAVIAACAATSTNIPATKMPPKPRQVLIVSPKGKFKNAVVARVKKLLQTESIAVTTAIPEDVAKFDAEKFSAIFVMDECWHGRLRKPSDKFVLGLPRKDRVVALMTANHLHFEVGIDGVDAITSASTTDQVETLSETIAKKLKQKLEK